MQRRRFVIGIGQAVGLAAMGGAGGHARRLLAVSDSQTEPVSHVARALGTDVSITVWHPDRLAAGSAVRAAFSELELVEQLMSIYRPDSQISQLNHSGVLKQPHPYLWEVLRAACELSIRSRGAFDVTVQPLWKLHAEAQQGGAVVDRWSRERCREKVDWRRVRLSEDRVRLGRADTQITLNGIAQGYAADRVLDALRRHGIQHALVDTGELAAIGHRAGGEPWRVGIQHPRVEDAFAALATLDHRCLATSGDYATAFDDRHARHHLFDPRTGDSARQFASVSIAAPTGLQADALSTAVFVLGPTEGLKLVRQTPGCDALMILRSGRQLVTPKFPRQAPA